MWGLDVNENSVRLSVRNREREEEEEGEEEEGIGKVQDWTLR